MAAEIKMVLIRRSQTMPISVDPVDSRAGTILAWARLRLARFTTGRVDEPYPDLGLAPDPDALQVESSEFLPDGGDGDHH